MWLLLESRDDVCLRLVGHELNSVRVQLDRFRAMTPSGFKELLRGLVPAHARMGHHQPQRSDDRTPDVLAVLGFQVRSETVGDDELFGERHRGIMITHEGSK